MKLRGSESVVKQIKRREESPADGSCSDLENWSDVAEMDELLDTPR